MKIDDLDAISRASFERFLADAGEIERHNREVAEVWDAFRNDRPTRVPVQAGGVSWKHLVMADPAASFRSYYTEPEVTARLQATSAMLTANIISDDMPRIEPERFAAFLDYWPFSDEAYWGAEVVFLDRQQPKLRRLFETEKIPPEEIEIPDPFESGFMALVSKQHESLSRVAREMVLFGRPFDPKINVGCMCTTYGVFNTAVQLRGVGLFMDVMDDPAYVTALTRKMAHGYAHRRRAWAERYRYAPPPPSIVYDHGVDMLSLEHYERLLVPVYRELKEMLGAEKYDACIEHCGRGEDVIRYKHKHFGINDFHNLNAAFLDLERLRCDLGPEVQMGVTICPEIVHSGPPERIRAAVKELLTPDLKGTGRLYVTICSHDYPEAPFEHIIAFHEAVKEYGQY